MVMIGSIIVVIFMIVVLLLVLSFTSLFSKVGKLALRGKENIKEKATEEYTDDEENSEK